MALHSVTAGLIRIENTGVLHHHSIVACGMPHHVAREEANMAAINAITYPICRDRHLLAPVNQNLHLAQVHHHVAGQHLVTVVGVLLTKAAPLGKLQWTLSIA